MVESGMEWQHDPAVSLPSPADLADLVDVKPRGSRVGMLVVAKSDDISLIIIVFRCPGGCGKYSVWPRFGIEGVVSWCYFACELLTWPFIALIPEGLLH